MKCWYAFGACVGIFFSMRLVSCEVESPREVKSVPQDPQRRYEQKLREKELKLEICYALADLAGKLKSEKEVAADVRQALQQSECLDDGFIEWSLSVDLWANPVVLEALISGGQYEPSPYILGEMQRKLSDLRSRNDKSSACLLHTAMCMLTQQTTNHSKVIMACNGKRLQELGPIGKDALVKDENPLRYAIEQACCWWADDVNCVIKELVKVFDPHAPILDPYRVHLPTNHVREAAGLAIKTGNFTGIGALLKNGGSLDCPYAFILPDQVVRHSTVAYDIEHITRIDPGSEDAQQARRLLGVWKSLKSSKKSEPAQEPVS